MSTIISLNSKVYEGLSNTRYGRKGIFLIAVCGIGACLAILNTYKLRTDIQ